MRVLSWNVRQGGGRRLGAIVTAISQHRPDLVVINELRARTASVLCSALAEIGLTHRETTAPSGLDNGTLIASRVPIERIADSAPTRILRHGLLEVEIANWGRIGAVYGPMLTPAHARFWNELAAHARDCAKGPHLLIGDFNTGEAGIDAYKNPFAGSDQFLAIRSEGFIDAWRACNAETEPTWFSFGRGGVRLNGFRIDHALVTTPLGSRVSACCYSHAERDSRLSDHSILLIDFAAPPT